MLPQAVPFLPCSVTAGFLEKHGKNLAKKHALRGSRVKPQRLWSATAKASGVGTRGGGKHLPNWQQPSRLVPYPEGCLRARSCEKGKAPGLASKKALEQHLLKKKKQPGRTTQISLRIWRETTTDLTGTGSARCFRMPGFEGISGLTYLTAYRSPRK